MDDTAVAPIVEKAPAPTGILWIASYPKSGNTWTRTFLHNLLKILKDDGGSPQNINGMKEFSTWEISAKVYEKHLGKPIEECDRKEIAATRPKVQQEIADRTDGLALVETHHALMRDRGTPTINCAVTSGTIYLVRNPLDVAISFVHDIGVTVDIAIERMASDDLETEESLYEVHGSWSQHVESWTRKAHHTIYVMRYEDMLANPFGMFGGLARHLLLRPTPEQLQTAIDRSSFDTLRKQEDEEDSIPDKTERYFPKVEQWREKLNRRQVRKIVQRHHVQMKRFGYLSDDLKSMIHDEA